MLLLLAAGSGHVKVVKWLLDKGANSETTDINGCTLLYMAARSGHALLRNHANTEGSGTNGWKPLQKVAESGRAEVVKAWLKGAKIERAGQEGRIPLHVTARFGHFDLAKMLLDKGANIEALCKDEWKALHVAARFGHVDLAKMLLDKRANKEATDRNGWSPLHLATSLGHVDLKGANIKTVDMDERTPLHWAARVDLTKTLLGQGANIEAADKTGLTPLHLAAQIRPC